jgi:hypothetical protein
MITSGVNVEPTTPRIPEILTINAMIFRSRMLWKEKM